MPTSLCYSTHTERQVVFLLKFRSPDSGSRALSCLSCASLGLVLSLSTVPAQTQPKAGTQQSPRDSAGCPDTSPEPGGTELEPGR